ncbi:hypothetical protein MC7420_6369 [Coleofasciculus chthonoplastes PCC 7420]|uniref:Uncharacterized protein n=1 Tax=Coleofasciculus chthonoplastes PCC 7420 TaxID=118168 RepID=B4VQT7_9CYAN|nr:hypothetical protein MC7420_6369 [Coleofasciculus chthonoplastes PCC 7420]
MGIGVGISFKLNVTDWYAGGLSEVETHPTIDKWFWRSPNAYFSAICVKLSYSLSCSAFKP